MKVLLIKDVKSLGKAGDVKDVKDGYGQNFLINKGLAKLATPEVLREYEEQKAKDAAALEAELKRLNEYKDKIEKDTLKIERESAPVGIRGSVTNRHITEELARQWSMEIDHKNINLKKAIKSEGLHEIDVKLGHGIHANLKVLVEGV